jgi:hypothetical protein
VPRTLLDLSAVVSRDELRGAMRHAETRRLADALTLSDLIERSKPCSSMPVCRPP